MCGFSSRRAGDAGQRVAQAVDKRGHPLRAGGSASRTSFEVGDQRLDVDTQQLCGLGVLREALMFGGADALYPRRAGRRYPSAAARAPGTRFGSGWGCARSSTAAPADRVERELDVDRAAQQRARAPRRAARRPAGSALSSAPHRRLHAAITRPRPHVPDQPAFSVQRLHQRVAGRPVERRHRVVQLGGQDPEMAPRSALRRCAAAASRPPPHCRAESAPVGRAPRALVARPSTRPSLTASPGPAAPARPPCGPTRRGPRQQLDGLSPSTSPSMRANGHRRPAARPGRRAAGPPARTLQLRRQRRRVERAQAPLGCAPIRPDRRRSCAGPDGRARSARPALSIACRSGPSWNAPSPP